MTTTDRDRELLNATARRHLHTLPVRASTAISAAVSELTDPRHPPTILGVDEADTRDPAAVLIAVRERLITASQQATTVEAAMACGQAARELRIALDQLAQAEQAGQQ